MMMFNETKIEKLELNNNTYIIKIKRIKNDINGNERYFVNVLNVDTLEEYSKIIKNYEFQLLGIIKRDIEERGI